MKGFYILVLSILIFSCSDLSLETESILVRSVEDGTVLQKGDTFEIVLDKVNDNVTVDPTNLEVVIEYQDDVVKSEDSSVSTVELEIDLNENLDLEFQISDDFEDGPYKMYITVFEEDLILSEHSSEFIVFTGDLDGEVDTFYPIENIYTNSKIILISKIDSDDYIDPYLIWKNGDEVISEGYLSEGYDSIIWDSEDLYGFINITLSLYPYKLSSSDIDSSNTVNYSFIINPLGSNLFDAEYLSNYHKLLFFNGNNIDEIDPFLDIKEDYDQNPGIYNEFYGMEITDSIGFETEDSFIPVNDDGNLESFSLIFDIQPMDMEDGIILTNIHGNLTSSYYVLNGILYHSFESDSNLENMTLTSVDTEESLKVVSSFIKVESGFVIYYYINGELIETTEWIIEDFSNEEIEKSFTVGGYGDQVGFNSLIGDLMVYNRDDSGNNNIYPHNSGDSADVKDDSLFEGFNSIYIPSNMNGVGYADGEYLIMDSEAELTFENILPLDMDYDLEIECESGTYTLNIFETTFNSYSSQLINDSIIKKRGDHLFINDEMVEEWDSTRVNFSITAESEISLDSISVESMDRIIETSI